MWRIPTWLAAIVILVFAALSAYGQSASKQARSALTLESFEIRGSDRLSADVARDEFGLRPGLALDDQTVGDVRSRLLGLGLFRACWLILKKGTRPGQAHLVINLEDDPGVVTDWAVGGSLGITYGETQAAAAGKGATPLGYKMGLVARNLFWAMHRGGVSADVDGEGVLREGQLAYGLPRFTAEGVQFDAEVGVVDPSRRYLDALGFGGRGQAQWSRNLSRQGAIRYGVASYVNQRTRYRMLDYPAQVSGPKVSYVYEERLLRFFPGAGSRLELGTVVAPNRGGESIGEVDLAHTFDLDQSLYVTIDVRALTAGIRNRALRTEARFDVPFAATSGAASSAGLFVRLRAGGDWTRERRYQGSSAILGLRYHSDGFIAEAGLQVTRSPEELTGRDFEALSLEGERR